MAEKKAKKAAPKKTTKVAKPKKDPAAAAAAPTEARTKKFQDYVIHTKRSGRYEVINKAGKNVNGLDKAKILVEAKLVKTGLTKKAPPPDAAPAGETAPT